MMQTFTVLTIYSENSYIVTEKQSFLGSLMAPVSFSYKNSIYVTTCQRNISALTGNQH